MYQNRIEICNGSSVLLIQRQYLNLNYVYYKHNTYIDADFIENSRWYASSSSSKCASSDERKILEYHLILSAKGLKCTCLSLWLCSDRSATCSGGKEVSNQSSNHWESLLYCVAAVFLIYRLHPPRQSSPAAPLVWGSGPASSSPSPAPWCWCSRPPHLVRRYQRRPWTLRHHKQHTGQRNNSYITNKCLMALDKGSHTSATTLQYHALMII